MDYKSSLWMVLKGRRWSINPQYNEKTRLLEGYLANKKDRTRRTVYVMYLTGGAKFKTADTILAGFNDRSAPQSGLRRTKTKHKGERERDSKQKKKGRKLEELKVEANGERWRIKRDQEKDAKRKKREALKLVVAAVPTSLLLNKNKPPLPALRGTYIAGGTWDPKGIKRGDTWSRAAVCRELSGWDVVTSFVLLFGYLFKKQSQRKKFPKRRKTQRSILEKRKNKPEDDANHFSRIRRGYWQVGMWALFVARTPWYELRRLQSSSSVSNSKIKIPARIQRDSTDILYALENTIPKDFTNLSYVYHDDPYLYPLRKLDYRNRALSYEAGRKTAMWIHAFKPPLMYTDKSQVSEEILLHAISKRMVSNALHIYKLLDSNVSNETKQLLLELLCFYNNETTAQNNLHLEQWFVTSQNLHIWQYTSEINELFEFLIKQDSSIAAAAYNVMICGLTKYSRTAEAWALYQKCEEENIPLNITTYNYILWLIPDIFSRKNELKIENLFNIINIINKRKIKPNVKTLNNALNVIKVTNANNKGEIAKRFLMEFKRLNIKFSLATYYYTMYIFAENNKEGHNNFLQILHSIENENFIIQDPIDLKFFKHAMYLASIFKDRKAGDMIHKFLLAKDNYKFISSAVVENAYYNSYLMLILSTSTIEEFFKFYENIVPNVFVPSKWILTEIIEALKHNSSSHLMKYIPRLWSDMNTYCSMESSVKFILLRLIQIDILPADSALRTDLVDIAWDCWNIIQKEIKKERYTAIENAVTACIAIILLHGDRVEESIKVMTYTVKESNLFLPTMNEKQLILEYSVNSGFSHIVEMATKLQNLSEFTNVDRQRLIDLVGVQALNSLDTEKLS
ncbi:hypothetical protein WN51_11414 [Melipona quadrifasciata]|uniref:Uncharacterized protein n=1 Tax=Melipona quadrifasciata TaxID=166423 RepID=A0A0M9ABD6_9HYME|nr:hypothetical protein WN51_11414 [Melipona quadrifasciata]